MASPFATQASGFADGQAGFFDTYFAVVNTGTAATTVYFTFRTSANTTVATSLYLPAAARATLYANSVAGLAGTTFRTLVTASQPIVVERAMYWPGTSGSGLMAGGGGDEAAMATLAAASGDDHTQTPLDPTPDAQTVADQARTRPYTLTVVEPADAISQARAAGTISLDEQAQLEDVARARAAFLRTAPPGTQSGVAPPLRTAGTAAGATAEGGATTTAIALPWTGGHLTLGRLQ